MIQLEDNFCENLLAEAEMLFVKCEFYKYSDLNNIQFSRNNGIVYKFYVKNLNTFHLKYIGKSTGKGFRSRLKAHFGGIGKGTQSKYKSICNEIDQDNEVYFKFIETSPIALRNLIEEMLIENCIKKLDLWNYK